MKAFQSLSILNAPHILFVFVDPRCVLGLAVFEQLQILYLPCGSEKKYPAMEKSLMSFDQLYNAINVFWHLQAESKRGIVYTCISTPAPAPTCSIVRPQEEAFCAWICSFVVGQGRFQKGYNTSAVLNAVIINNLTIDSQILVNFTSTFCTQLDETYYVPGNSSLT